MWRIPKDCRAQVCQVTHLSSEFHIHSFPVIIAIKFFVFPPSKCSFLLSSLYSIQDFYLDRNMNAEEGCYIILWFLYLNK